MTNIEVIKRFLRGEQGQTAKRVLATGAEGRTLYTEGNKLINYNTVIAELRGDTEGKELEVNATRYSKTTSKIQTELIRQANQLRREGKQLFVVMSGSADRVEWLNKYVEKF